MKTFPEKKRWEDILVNRKSTICEDNILYFCNVYRMIYFKKKKIHFTKHFLFTWSVVFLIYSQFHLLMLFIIVLFNKKIDIIFLTSFPKCCFFKFILQKVLIRYIFDLQNGNKNFMPKNYKLSKWCFEIIYFQNLALKKKQAKMVWKFDVNLFNIF